MLDEVTTAIATGAAGNVIAYMLNDRIGGYAQPRED